MSTVTVETRADLIRERVRSDMVSTLRAHFGLSAYVPGRLVEDLVEDAMFHVEHLLAEAEVHSVHEWKRVCSDPTGRMHICIVCHEPGWLV